MKFGETRPHTQSSMAMRQREMSPPTTKYAIIPVKHRSPNQHDPCRRTNWRVSSRQSLTTPMGCHGKRSLENTGFTSRPCARDSAKREPSREPEGRALTVSDLDGAKNLLATGISAREIGRQLSVAHMTLLRAIRRSETALFEKSTNARHEKPEFQA